jgi:branched-chain amino acid transport system substrate-binding protein
MVLFAIVITFAGSACASGSGSGAPVGSATPAPPMATAPEASSPESTAAPTGSTDDVGGAVTTTGEGTVPPSAPQPAAPDSFIDLQPPTGEPIRIGMVNTEGTPGLDFPEMRTGVDLAIDYLNQHGGMGGRPIEIEHCTVNGSPETSQACAQELAGKGVELVMLGLDLFPGYDAFAASGVPVFGALPILPADYTADALFVTGGNATTMAAVAALALEHFHASTVGIISADNPGANSSSAALTAALDKAGLEYQLVKGGDNETDAGYQGLMREASQGDPDVLVSLYSDAGCIGAMRGRASLAITTPVITTGICAGSDVLDVVGDDAVGWFFVGVGTTREGPTATTLRELIAPQYGDAEPSALGIGVLAVGEVMTLARAANRLAEAGQPVTGAAIRDTIAHSVDLASFPDDNLLACGIAPSYPSVCGFDFPVGEFLGGGEIRTVDGFESFSVVDYLP